MDVVSIVGAILSAIGAAIAVWQAYRARTFRDEILQDRRKMALVEAIGIARKAREECRKIVKPVGRAGRGVDPQQVVNTIRDCAERLRDNAHKFQSPRVGECVSKLEQLIETYARASEDEVRYTIAGDMYKALSDAICIVGVEIDRAV